MTKSPSILLAPLIALASLAPSQAASQEEQRPPNAGAASRDSLPFRARQWGAEFAIDDGTVGLGVLRFRSARSAWFLDASFLAGWSDRESSIGNESGNDVFVRGRVGSRTYRPVRAAIASHVGIGVTGGYAWLRRGDYRTHTWDAGVFGELGAAYFVTPHLSLGARVEASVLFSEFQRRAPDQGWRDRNVRLGVSPVRIVGALYF
jgi:hypothetical protein